MESQTLTQRFRDALQYATQLHNGQVRKGTTIPYVSHLLAVTAMVLEDGGDEDQAIAALLHDAVEDQGGQATLEQIRLRFGALVAELVDGCTDTYETPKPPWRARKEDYLNHLKSAPEGVLRISLADKLHNAHTILRDLHTIGPPVWQRFNGGMIGTLWYYRSLVDFFASASQSPLVGELKRVIEELEALALSGDLGDQG